MGRTGSMGRTGLALDNAAAGSFNSTLEFELLRERRFSNMAEAGPRSRSSSRYNTTRLHSNRGHAQPHQLRTRTTPGRGMKRGRRVWNAATQVVPPASRAATRSLRDGLRPPLTPQHLRPGVDSKTGTGRDFPAYSRADPPTREPLRGPFTVSGIAMRSNR